MAVVVETVGANGMPPTVMVFQVTVTEEHLGGLLWSAGRMPAGERSVPGHLRDALLILLTGTGGDGNSPAGGPVGGSSDGGGALTPSAGQSSKAKTLHRILTEDDVDAVKA